MLRQLSRLLAFVLTCGCMPAELAAPAYATDVVLNRPVPPLQSGPQFKAELRRSISASWNNVSVRQVLRSISEKWRVAILLDRRIDPTRQMAFEVQDNSLGDVVGTVASRAAAEMSLLQNAFYVGPQRSAAKLRTLFELRSTELFNLPSLPDRRRIELARRRTLHWNDLDTPADVLKQIAGYYRLGIQGLDQIPHDLWATSTLPRLNAAESLSLVLIQFDLTFQWTARAAGIRIVPVPKVISVERTYTPRKLTATAAVSEWRELIPGLQAQVAGRNVIVRGTVENHEAVAEHLRPGSKTVGSKTSTKPTPFVRRKFDSLRVKNVPVRALMQQLEKKTSIKFAYNANALAAAKINLNQLISLELKDASAEALLRAIFDPIGLKFAIDGQTIRLEPK